MQQLLYFEIELGSAKDLSVCMELKFQKIFMIKLVPTKYY